MSDRKPGDPYEVGFARPPKRTRFKKGLSGNPRGRPRKKPDTHAELLAVLEERVSVTIDGEPREVTVQQALLLRLREEANRGRAWAAKLVLKIIEAMPEGLSPLEAQLQQYRVHLELQKIADRFMPPQKEPTGGTDAGA